jgi:hypothetical protein
VVHRNVTLFKGERKFQFAIQGLRLFFPADATRLRQGCGVVEVGFRITSFLF